jgi:four helix bundle protein
MERKNINRGFTQLRVWNSAIELYILVCKRLANMPYDLRKSVSNATDACQSISRNIAEGYCRKSTADYLKFLNYSISSSGELFSCLYSFKAANQISEEAFEEIDILHYKTENELLALIKSLENKIRRNNAKSQ